MTGKRTKGGGRTAGFPREQAIFGKATRWRSEARMSFDPGLGLRRERRYYISQALGVFVSLREFGSSNVFEKEDP